MEPFDGLRLDRVGAGDHLRWVRGVHRRRSQGVVDALLSEFVLRIEVQRGSKLCHRLHLPATEQVGVAAFQMHSGQMLTRKLTRRKVLHILRDQARRFLKFVKSLVEVARFLEFEAARKGLAGSFQVVGGTMASRRTTRIGAERRRSGQGSVCGETHPGKQQTNSRWQPSHMTTIECPPAAVLQEKSRIRTNRRNGQACVRPLRWQNGMLFQTSEGFTAPSTVRSARPCPSGHCTRPRRRTGERRR